MHFALLFLAPLVSLHAADDEKAAQPNVLLTITDDQGFGDFGFNRNKLVRTPYGDGDIWKVGESHEIDLLRRHPVFGDCPVVPDGDGR